MRSWMQTRNAVLMALLALATGLIYLSQSGCTGTYDAAWRITYATREAGTLADRTLAEVVMAKHRACSALADPAAYEPCIAKHRKALESWRTYARPSLNTALTSTVFAIKTAEDAKNKKLDWRVILRDGVCAVARGLSEWGALLPPGVRASVEAALKLAVSFSCPPSKESP
jgi:hypothetical protein